ncbi:hypothetical protein H696_01013 [Fonticula alba]|uniref:Peptidase S8/S53 domain-containing protein n=1 Tax=Fonticula alba TaxID=691883 RepID=A0A058ZGL6_FONAL|nr:hypothetical protein H696_01013 [Fonticula alba]KCV73474.1 hypothetical protein H696_01013 [Fonticula alba]|eukprot:XP_009493175.1 hypothetical protein H696_01013 [Fonticula alba]
MRHFVARVLLALVWVSALVAGQTPDPVRIMDNPHAETIPDRFIVVFHGVTSVEQARSFSEEVGSGTFFHIGSRFKALVGALLPEALARIQARGDLVAYIEPDQAVRLAAISQKDPPWNLDRLDQRSLPLDNRYWYYDHAGAGASVYVLDTGINKSHVGFKGNLHYGWNFHDNTPYADDYHGHGTAVAGIIGSENYGVAKSAAIFGVRVTDNAGSGTNSALVQGIGFVAEAHRKSMRKMTVGSISLLTPASQALDDAVLAATEAGVLFVSAAGNGNGDACQWSPGRLSEVLNVASVNNRDTRMSASNFGPCVDIFAPGDSIPTTGHASSTAVSYFSGTSAAAPHASGVAALVLANFGPRSPADLRKYVLEMATNNKVIDSQGSPNRLLFSMFA